MGSQKGRIIAFAQTAAGHKKAGGAVATPAFERTDVGLYLRPVPVPVPGVLPGVNGKVENIARVWSCI